MGREPERGALSRDAQNHLFRKTKILVVEPDPIVAKENGPFSKRPFYLVRQILTQ